MCACSALSEIIFSQRLRIVWFGNTTNVFYVCSQLEQLMKTVSYSDSIELVVLTHPGVFKMLEELLQAFYLMQRGLGLWSFWHGIITISRSS